MTRRQLAALRARLKREYERHDAPIVDLVQVQTEDVFKVLVATILSARTQDGTTARACERLFQVVRGPADLRTLSREDIERRIYPVGFYRTKARHLKELPEALAREFGGEIPCDIDLLCRLPGVGRKTANLVVAMGFGRPALCVDVHVHRISNRLGLVRTRTPFETETELRRVLPRPYWRTWNSYLVSYGQTVCRPVRPRCSACVLRAFCARVGVPDPAALRAPPSQGAGGASPRSRG